MKFSWDPAEARRNLAKHGISFKTATRVFADPHAVMMEDYEDSFGELRYHAIGYAESHLLLLVVFVMREEGDREIHHIISARKAVDYEISAYADQF